VALILPLLVLLVGAAIDGGLLLFVSHIVQNAVQEGARWAVTRADIKQADVVTQVNERIPETPLFEDFRSRITASCTVSSGKPFITVQTNGTFRYNFMSLIGFNSTEITRSAGMQYERSAATCPTGLSSPS
jgi:Flp pilus assembly protein TadG